MGQRIAIYPGSFDPPTLGHLDVIERGARLFDRVIVAVARNQSKSAMFELAPRMSMVEDAVAHLSNVSVDSFSGLLVDFVANCSAQVVIRGLRAVSDFEYEFQMALMNRRLREDVETIFLTPRESYTFLSSSIVKEVASLGGSVDALVPPNVAGVLQKTRLNAS